MNGVMTLIITKLNITAHAEQLLYNNVTLSIKLFWMSQVECCCFLWIFTQNPELYFIQQNDTTQQTFSISLCRGSLMFSVTFKLTMLSVLTPIECKPSTQNPETFFHVLKWPERSDSREEPAHEEDSAPLRRTFIRFQSDQTFFSVFDDPDK